MEQTQQKALNALEPYILLSKSANSPRAAADLITQATSAPNTFVFAELLQTPNIQALQTASQDYSPYLTLLHIFAWGTWSDYTGRSETPCAKLICQSVLSRNTKSPRPLRRTSTEAPPTHFTLPRHVPLHPQLRALAFRALSSHHSRPGRPRHKLYLRRTSHGKTRYPVPACRCLVRCPSTRSKTWLCSSDGFSTGGLG